jgi:hypothetical protein
MVDEEIKKMALTRHATNWSFFYEHEVRFERAKCVKKTTLRLATIFEPRESVVTTS